MIKSGERSVCGTEGEYVSTFWELILQCDNENNLCDNTVDHNDKMWKIEGREY